MINEAKSITHQIPELLHTLEVTLRSGYNISQSLEIVNKDLAEPIATEIQHVLAEVEAGTSWLTALDNWFNRCPSFELDMLVATMHEQMESGGNLANKLQFIAQLLPKLKRIGWSGN